MPSLGCRSSGAATTGAALSDGPKQQNVMHLELCRPTPQTCQNMGAYPVAACEVKPPAAPASCSIIEGTDVHMPRL